MKLKWNVPLLVVALAVAWTVVLLSAPATALPGPDAPQVYNTGNSSERTSRLSMVRYPGAPPKYAVFCVNLGTAPAGGEILVVLADLEVTNGLGYNVSVVTHVLLASGCATTGTEITEANGENAVPAVHHEVPVRVGSLVVPAGNTRTHVVLVAWAASTRAQPGHYIQVMRDYGRMTVLRWR